MFLFAIITYLSIGLIIFRPWDEDGGFFFVPTGIKYALSILWLPILAFRFPSTIREKGFKAFTDPIKVVLLHVWLPFMMYYKILDMVDDIGGRQFQKNMVFSNKLTLELFKKVQSAKEQIGYIFWGIGEETVLPNGSILVECQMVQRLM